jgi:hypothetical protein
MTEQVTPWRPALNGGGDNPSYWCDLCRSFHPDTTPHAAVTERGEAGELEDDVGELVDEVAVAVMQGDSTVALREQIAAALTRLIDGRIHAALRSLKRADE